MKEEDLGLRARDDPLRALDYFQERYAEVTERGTVKMPRRRKARYLLLQQAREQTLISAKETRQDMTEFMQQLDGDGTPKIPFNEQLEALLKVERKRKNEMYPPFPGWPGQFQFPKNPSITELYQHSTTDIYEAAKEQWELKGILKKEWVQVMFKNAKTPAEVGLALRSQMWLMGKGGRFDDERTGSYFADACVACAPEGLDIMEKAQKLSGYWRLFPGAQGIGSLIAYFRSIDDAEKAASWESKMVHYHGKTEPEFYSWILKGFLHINKPESALDLAHEAIKESKLLAVGVNSILAWALRNEEYEYGIKSFEELTGSFEPDSRTHSIMSMIYMSNESSADKVKAYYSDFDDKAKRRHWQDIARRHPLHWITFNQDKALALYNFFKDNGLDIPDKIMTDRGVETFLLDELELPVPEKQELIIHPKRITDLTVAEGLALSEEDLKN